MEALGSDAGSFFGSRHSAIALSLILTDSQIFERVHHLNRMICKEYKN